MHGMTDSCLEGCAAPAHFCGVVTPEGAGGLPVVMYFLSKLSIDLTINVQNLRFMDSI
jgi:hypothetical protein